jgi:hypothetical protein
MARTCWVATFQLWVIYTDIIIRSSLALSWEWKRNSNKQKKSRETKKGGKGKERGKGGEGREKGKGRRT